MNRLIIRRSKKESGAALFTAMVLLISLTVLGFTAVMMTTIDQKISRNILHQKRALWAAEEGVMLGAGISQVNKYYDEYGDVIEFNIANFKGTGDYHWSFKQREGKAYSDSWNVRVVKECLAPPASEITSLTDPPTYNQYRITATGSTSSGVTETVEILGRVKISGGSGDISGKGDKMAGVSK